MDTEQINAHIFDQDGDLDAEAGFELAMSMPEEEARNVIDAMLIAAWNMGYAAAEAGREQNPFEP